MPWWVTLLLCIFGGATALLLVARFLALQAVRTAVSRERMDRALDAAKAEEAERAANATKAITDDKAREDARIEAMTPEETEREVNK
jgi:hypothetical protein